MFNFKKNILTFSLLFLIFLNSSAAGEIAFTSYQSDNPDQFTFVPLINLPAGYVINFTDNGWTAAGAFRTGEGTITWTAPSGGIMLGTAVTINYTNATTNSTTSGSITVSGSFGLNNDGDQIFAYTGTETSPNFLSGIHFANTVGWNADAIDASTSTLPSSLTNGQTALYMGNFDNGKLNCSAGSITNSQTGLQSTIYTTSNWTLSNPILSPSTNACNIALPVSLIFFVANLDNNSNSVLSWATANETNNDYFKIQKSIDAKSFEDIAEIKGKGTFQQQSDYLFTDFKTISGTLYYRLKQVDFDGKYSFSKIVSLNNQDFINPYFYPNPVLKEINIDLGVNEYIDQIAIYDILGRKVLNARNLSRSIDLSNLPTGKYIVECFTSEKRMIRANIIKE